MPAEHHLSVAPQPDRTSGVRPLHVLVVDDYPDAVDLLSHSLGRHGYAVQTAVSGPEALALFVASRPGAVVLDLRMPVMDGTMVFTEMHRSDPDVPVIIVTANSDEGLARALLQRDAFDYLPKPVDLDHLAVVVGAATGQPWPAVAPDREGRTAAAPPSVTQVAYAVMAVARRLVGPDAVRQRVEHLAHDGLREALLGRPRTALERLVETRRLLASGSLASLGPADLVALRTALAPLEQYLPQLDGGALTRAS